MCQLDSSISEIEYESKIPPKTESEKDVATGTAWCIIPWPTSHALKQPSKICWFHLICDQQFMKNRYTHFICNEATSKQNSDSQTVDQLQNVFKKTISRVMDLLANKILLLIQ